MRKIQCSKIVIQIFKAIQNQFWPIEQEILRILIPQAVRVLKTLSIHQVSRNGHIYIKFLVYVAALNCRFFVIFPKPILNVGAEAP